MNKPLTHENMMEIAEERENMNEIALDIVHSLCQTKYPASHKPCVDPCENCCEESAAVIRAVALKLEPWNSSPVKLDINNSHLAFMQVQRQNDRNFLLDISNSLLQRYDENKEHKVGLK